MAAFTTFRHLWTELRRRQAGRSFRGSAHYWERRYATGGSSGPGSAGELAAFKADQVNRLVREHDIQTVLDVGSGDGQQLALLDVPTYVGVDVSATAVEACRRMYGETPNRRFMLASDGPLPKAELALSMQVTLHLIEDPVFERYMRELFQAATRMVVIFDADAEGSPWPHVRFRRFTQWIVENIDGWQLAEVVDGPSLTDPRPDLHVYVPSGEREVLPRPLRS